MLDQHKNDLGEFTYKLHSATTHGTVYGLARFVRKVDDRAPGMPDGVIAIGSDEVILTLRVLLFGYIAMLDTVRKLLNWENPEWQLSVANANAYFVAMDRKRQSP